ncbi:MAG: beta-propeller domain-containing protein [Clostridia bacterium]|nr:beta-propeller domain-containing protein [Clostridia bacterium]
MKNKRLLQSLGFIDEKYVKEAEPKMKASSISPMKIFGRVACLVLVIALSLYLFIPFSTEGPNLTAYRDSEYFPLIETIADYRYQPSRYKNNFEVLTAGMSNLLGGLAKGDANADYDDSNAGSAPEATPDGSNGNGSYVEVTDNQVAGVVEADIIKRTDKYIFRLGRGTLKVYSIAKEETKRVADIEMPRLSDEHIKYDANAEMYLSSDGNTLTIIKRYSDASYNSKVGIISLDVSNIEDIKVKGEVSIDGSYSSSRMVDGKLLLISEYYFNSSKVEYDKPETYVPTVTKNGEKDCIRFEDIIFPETIGNTRYSVVALLDEDNLDVLGASALLNFNGAIYVSENNVYVARQYTETVDLSEESHGYYSIRKSDIAVLNYSGEALVNKGILTVDGSIKDQYSMDEKDGHLRVVTSTNDYGYSPDIDENEYIVSIIGEKNESVSLTVFKLDGCEKIAEVKDFAPEGEEAVSVRFDGDNAYVCTAVVVTFTDPVYFFDLSDYANITYTDTGVIEGFSTSLIQLGDGFLLGIGRENSVYNKVEVYEEIDGEVVSVDKYFFEGEYSTEYKSYLVNRDKDMFGFGVTYFYNEKTGDYEHMYILLAFNGYELVEVAKVRMDSYDVSRFRAVLIEDYLYITDDTQIKVVSLINE